jgi:hypothetical protein
MDASLLAGLAMELFAAIRLVSGYPVPEALPEIHRVPQSELQQRVCAGKRCAVQAFYHPEWGVFVADSLDLQNDPFDRSILLHELVHHLQKTTGKFNAVPGNCNRRTAQELEAYEIQNRYLAEQHASRRAVSIAGTCREEE